MKLREKIEQNLSPNETVFEEREDWRNELEEILSSGNHPVCSKCGTRLEVALTSEEAKAKNISPGVLCPKNNSHCQININLKR